MKAIVLAAGRGSRLNQLTENRPKCLVELAGHSLLSWQTEALRKVGFRDIILVGGYRRECLPCEGYVTLVNLRWSETNMVATLRCASEYLRKETVVVAYADILYHPSIIERLMAAQGDLVITYDRLWAELWRERFENPLSDAETFQLREGLVVEIGERAKDLDQVQGQYMGLLKFTPASWRTVELLLDRLSIRQQESLDMTSLLRQLVQQGFPVGAVAVDGGWCEVDSEADLRLYGARIKESDTPGRSWQHDWRW